MTDYFVSNSGSDSNPGTGVSPFLTIAKLQATLGISDRGFLNGGDVWYELFAPPADDITLEPYGSGALPLLDGTEQGVTSWTGAGVGFWYFKALATYTAGVMFEDDTALTFIAWDTDLATTVAGSVAGSYTFNPGTLVAYIWSSDDADPDTHIIDISRRQWCIDGSGGGSGLIVKDIDMRGAKQHNIELKDYDTVTLSGLTSRECGGLYSGSSYAGNAIQVGDGCSDVGIINPITNDVFDVGVSIHCFTNNASIDNVRVRGSNAARCGFSGIEQAIIGVLTGCSIDDTDLKAVTIADSGLGWSGDRNGLGKGLISLTPANNTSLITNTVMDDINIDGCVGPSMSLSENVGAIKMNNLNISNGLDRGLEMATTLADANMDITLVNSDISSCVGHGMLFQSSIAPFSIQNNVFNDNGVIGSGTYNVLFTTTNNAATKLFKHNQVVGDASIALVNQFALVGADFDYNDYYDLSANGSAHYNGITYTSAQLAAYQAACGMEANSTFNTSYTADVPIVSTEDVIKPVLQEVVGDVVA